MKNKYFILLAGGFFVLMLLFMAGIILSFSGFKNIATILYIVAGGIGALLIVFTVIEYYKFTKK